MPYDDPDATDPMTLRGVVVETENEDAIRDMAECFVEEYMRSGFDAERIMKMFKTQGYVGPFLAYQTLGEDAIRRVIAELEPLWSGRRPEAQSTPDTNGRTSLPILES